MTKKHFIFVFVVKYTKLYKKKISPLKGNEQSPKPNNFGDLESIYMPRQYQNNNLSIKNL